MQKNKGNLILFAAFMAMILCSLTAHADEYWDQRVSLFNKLPIENCDIVFLGNSITDGGEFNELFGMENIKNRGIRSDVIGGVRKRLDQVTSGHPQKIFLLIGINDVSHGKTVERLASDYESLVKEIIKKSPDTKLYIQSIFPINNSFGRYRNLKGREHIIKGLNEQLKQIADNNGAVYIDLWPALSDKNGNLKKEFTNDGLHLLGPGYKAWAAAIKDYVKE